MHSVFLDVPPEYQKKEQSKYCIIPVPFDKTSTWQKGADKGPEAILEASQYVELYDIETDSTPYKKGIYTFSDSVDITNSEQMVASTKNIVTRVVNEGIFPIVIGGEHSVAIGSSIAVLTAYKHCSVLQLDAHSDLREEYNGSRLNHACTMARIKEHAAITQVGIRSMDESELSAIEKNRFFTPEAIDANPHWIQKVVDTLSEYVYLTLDLDVFDPSIMPSTGTPEPGGLSWYQVCNLIKGVCTQRTLVGCDITELCPTNTAAPNFLTAKLIYKIISYHNFYQ